MDAFFIFNKSSIYGLSKTWFRLRYIGWYYFFCINGAKIEVADDN